MAFDQLDIHSINADSGVYRLRLNFDGNVNWISTGTKTSINSRACIVSLGELSSSRASEDLENLLGNLKVEFSDHPFLEYADGTGNIIRECFEEARTNGYNVHAILARYSNATTPVFQEFVFAGTFDPREMTVAHRRVSPVERRTETLTVEFTPAKMLDVPLSSIDWQETDMDATPRPIWLCIVDEPGYKGGTKYWRFMPKKLSGIVVDGKAPYGAGFIDYGRPTSLTHELAYGSHPLSGFNPDIGDLRDNVGIGPFPLGNWSIKLRTIITKLFAACNIEWDGVLPSNLQFRASQFNNDLEHYEDIGQVDPNDVTVSWNYVFGVNPYDGTSFKSPITFDGDMYARDFLKAIAAQMKSRIDIYGYNATGLPIARFLKFGQTSGVFPDLEERQESGEDAFVTDKDGVRITRRGFSGAVIAPADARNPVDIEIPFAPYAIGYEIAPAFDASRLTPNDALPFEEQWKCGHRGALQQEGATEDTYPLNPDGWVVAAHLFWPESGNTLTHFPISHEYPLGSGYDADNEEIYQAGGWAGYYPLHAIYEIDESELSALEKIERQKDFKISYALTFGRYLRGERRRLSKSFKGCVAPNWSDIKNGQTYIFQPLTDDVEYNAVEIHRDILTDIISVQFEETSPDTLPISYRIEGDSAGNGSLGSQGSTEGATGTGESFWEEQKNTTAPNATIPATVWTPATLDPTADNDAIIAPKGDGGLGSQIPDNLVTGGNKRGKKSVDLSRVRDNADQVASGDHAVQTGVNNKTTADHAITSGRDAHSYLYGAQTHSSGKNDANGDSQTFLNVLRIKTTDATVTEIFIDGVSERLVLRDGSSYTFDIDINAFQTNGSGADGWKLKGVISRGSGVGTVVFRGQPVKINLTQNASGWDCNIVNDTTNGALKITVTGEVAKDINWTVKIRVTENLG